MIKDIEGFEGLYAIDTEGNVWSYVNQRYLKPYVINKKGYMGVKLRRDGESYNCRIHRLVAETFIPNPDGLNTVDHIDGNKTNNKVENLQWMALGDNVRKANGYKILCIDTNQIYDSINQAAKDIEVDPSALSRALAKDKPCKGYYFERIFE